MFSDLGRSTEVGDAMTSIRRAALVVASAIAVGVAVSAAPAAEAEAPQFACYHQGGSALFPVGTPGTPEFRNNARDCLSIDKYNTYIAPTR